MLKALLPVVALVVIVACSGGDEDPSDQITRIEGPAVVDEDVLNGSGDDSSGD
ncbi:MAG: hypothetical protein ACJA14_002683 [Ilumatobacter sp.]|jgi:hypothetical protein